MRTIEPAGFGLLLVAGLMAAGGALAEPARQSPQARARVNARLAEASGREALSRGTGGAAQGCIPASKSSELCGWKLEDGDAGWAPLAAAIGVRDSLNLLCELPRDGSARAGDACSAAPRRSNAASFLQRPTGKRGARKREGVSRAERQREYEALATAWIREARTLVALSRLMGALPDACEPIDDSRQSCLWLADERLYGHGTVVTWFGVSARNDVRFTCLLPVDGGKRAKGTCQASIGK